MSEKKKTIANQLAARGNLFVAFDPRREGVVVPDHLRHTHLVKLLVGLNLYPAIEDLRVNDYGISGTLSFSGQPFHCTVPWTSVYGLVSEDNSRGKLFEEDYPDELFKAVDVETRRAAFRVVR